MDNIHQAIYDFIKTYPPIDYLFFNINVAEDDSFSIIPISHQRNIEEFIDGTSLERDGYYDFAIVAFTAHTTEPYINDNLNNLMDIQQMIIWIEEQNKAGNRPDLGPEYEVTKIEVLVNIPNTAGQDEHLTKIMFQGRVSYYKK